jgi:hypothetical protein
MTIRYPWLLLILALSITILPLGRVSAFPSSDFTYNNGEWYDSWGINRNSYDGSHGYLPNLAYETLDSNKELAFSLGESFKNNYASTTSRAEAILNYVQTWTTYGYDSENVVRDGVSQDEWAWNADEMAHNMDKTAGIKAVGDCEDMAFLCATIYTGAGIDAAIVDAPEHVACLIWLPEYPNADNYWNLPNDNRNAGWIWVEATGESNPLGWTPPDFADGNWNAYPISSKQPTGIETTPLQPNEPEPFPMDLMIIGIIVVLILIALSVFASSKKKNAALFSTPQPLTPPPPDS